MVVSKASDFFVGYVRFYHLSGVTSLAYFMPEEIHKRQGSDAFFFSLIFNIFRLHFICSKILVYDQTSWRMLKRNTQGKRG